MSFCGDVGMAPVVAVDEDDVQRLRLGLAWPARTDQMLGELAKPSLRIPRSTSIGGSWVHLS